MANFFKTQLMEKEFPFLTRFVEAEVADARNGSAAEVLNSITVQRADEALLNSKATEDSYSWCQGGHHHYRRITAVWLEGQDDFQFAAAEKSASGGGDWSDEDAPTIGEQLAESGLKAPDFIVVRDKQDTDDWGRGNVVRDITIYKVGKFDLEGYYAQRIDEAAAELKAELARISS